MQQTTLTYEEHRGWNQPLPTHLDSDQTLVLLFFSPELQVENLIQEVRQSFPRAKIAGCSGAGEVHGAELLPKGLVLTVCKFEKSKVKCFTSNVERVEDSFAAGELAGADLAGDKLAGVFIISDGLHINGTDLVKGILKGVKSDIPISGGLAGDGENFKRTLITDGTLLKEKMIVAIGFYGEEISFVSDSQAGWSPFGPQREITKSHSNVLYELDGKSALSLYKEFLGPMAAQLPASGMLFPLLIDDDSGNNRDIIRSLLSINEQTQSMTFAGDMPMHAKVNLMRSTTAELITAALKAGQNCLAGDHGQNPILSIVVSCVGRKIILGQKTEDELEIISRLLPAGSVQTGFYSYGEIAPNINGLCDLHNQTMTLTMISERL